MTAQISNDAGKLDLNIRIGTDLSFDVTINGLDLTNYDLSASIVPMEIGSMEIPIVITPIDLTLGQLHFLIDELSIKDLPILTEKHRWCFKVNTPKQEIPAIAVYTRAILAGYVNILGN